MLCAVEGRGEVTGVLHSTVHVPVMLCSALVCFTDILLRYTWLRFAALPRFRQAHKRAAVQQSNSFSTPSPVAPPALLQPCGLRVPAPVLGTYRLPVCGMGGSWCRCGPVMSRISAVMSRMSVIVHAVSLT
jgi:hypothetical protein